MDEYKIDKPNYWKVLLPSMCGKPHSGISCKSVHVSPPTEIFSESYIAIVCKDEADAKCVKDYILSE